MRRLLADAVTHAWAGRGSTLLLPGEPGIGKTRTLELLGELASASGLRVVRGACSEVGGAPALLPWAQILEALGNAESLGERDPAEPTGADGRAQFRLFRAVADVLLAHASEQPLALLLDDVHAADLGSARLLDFVAREVERAPILLAIAYREIEIPAHHPLRPSIENVGRRASTLPLEALGARDVTRLASGVAHCDVAPQVAALLQERSQGNPLFAIQLVELLLAQGCDMSDPKSVERARTGAPESVRHVLRARMLDLSEDSRRALEAGAVIGRHFDADLLPTAAALKALDGAARVGIIIPDDQVPGRWRFAHVLFRDTLLEDLDPTPLRELHLSALDAIAQKRDLDEDRWLAAAALHARESLSGEGAALARDLTRRAGERALARHAHEDAIAWFEDALRALELEGDLEPEERAVEALRVLPRLGEARWRSGQVAAGRAAFARTLELARKVNDPRAFAEAAVGFAGRTDAVLGPEDESSALLVEALERLGDEPSRLRADVLTRLTSALYFSSDAKRRDATSLAAIACAEALDDPDALAYALTARHYVLQRPGQLTDRRLVADRTLKILKGRPEHSATAIAHLHAVLDHLEEGDLAGVNRHVKAYGDIAERLREPFLIWQYRALGATQALAAGDLGLSEERAHRALELGRAAESPNAVTMFSSHLFCLRRAAGRLGELVPMLAPLVQEFPDVPAYAYARAEAQLSQGRSGEVRAFLSGQRPSLASLPLDYNWPVLVSIGARLAASLDDAESAELLYRAVRSAAGRCVVFPFGSGWDGAFDLSLGRLATVLGRNDEALCHLEAAEALHARVGARLALSETWQALAALQHRRGDRAEERRRASDAAALRRELGLDADRKSQAVGAAPTARFVRRGNTWELAFQDSAATLPNARGLAYLAELVAQPGESVHVLDLTARRNEGSAADAGAQLDARARQEARTRMHELQGELDEVEVSGDLARSEALRGELQRLEEELVRALGLGGRARRLDDPVERARKAVYARIRAALGQIEAELPELARHLRHSVRTGRSCRYAPETELRWVLD